MNRLLLAALLAAGCTKPENRVAVACAEDAEYAKGIFADFTSATGLGVAAKFDTEASKSVGLAEELAAEAGRPRSDVYWNNEIVHTIRLAHKGVLAEYRSPSAESYPAWSKAKDGTWQAFAARARVLVVNTNLVAERDRPTSVFDLADPRWKGRIALAKPLFGTTATHAACLWDVLGADAAADFYRRVKANDAAILSGNRPVAQRVGAGEFAFGLTDTDDAVEEIEAGRPVAVVYPDRAGHPASPRLGTLYIPNTVAVVKGGPNPDGAKKLVDYLLSAAVEQKLAEGGGSQIPLNPRVEAKLHPALVRPEALKAMDADFERAVDQWDAAQTTLRDLFNR